ncbi:SH3 domain-containing protein [Amanita rubescens]|nr:SH3 domain-containing protein [Amanita rubescens]
MNLVKGEYIERIRKPEEYGWWSGVGPGGKWGLFPSNYVELVDQPEAIALYDLEAEEDKDLSIRKGDEIIKISAVTKNWWVGTLADGRRGFFPANYVELR